MVFTDRSICSIAPITTWELSLGDGRIYRDDQQRDRYLVTHRYETNGVYLAGLTITDANGLNFVKCYIRLLKKTYVSFFISSIDSPVISAIS